MTSIRLATSAVCAMFAASACSGTRTLALPPQVVTAQRSAAQAGGGDPGDVIATAAPIAEIGARDLGPAPSRQRMTLAVALKYRDQTGLDALVEGQRRGASAWLTDPEFNARFSPSKETYESTIRALQKAGFALVATYPNRTVLDVQGAVGTIERYFGTTVHVVDQNGKKRLANVTAARAPSGLRGAVLAVMGLSTLILVQTQNRVVNRFERHPFRATRQPGFPYYGPIDTGPQSPEIAGYGPKAFLAAYDYPSRHGDFKGAKRNAAIVIDADFTDGDLDAYLKYFKIGHRAANTVRVAINHGAPPGDEGADSLEATLDIEVIASLVPQAKTYVYEMPSLTTANVTDTYERVVSDNLADAVNSSFGGCENALGTAPKAWNALFEQGLAKGMTFSASSGDGGSTLCQLAPSSSPFVASVGGTAMIIGLDGAWQTESAWSGGGGGVSSIERVPAWQRPIQNVLPTGRNLPDLALDANPESGMALYFIGTWNNSDNPIGGTSLSSPLYIAGILQMAQVKGVRLGLASAGIFSALEKGGYGTKTVPIFHDITLGGNGLFYAQVGYDQATGIGSPDFWNLLRSLR